MKVRTEVYASDSGEVTNAEEAAVRTAKEALDKAIADYDQNRLDRLTAESTQALHDLIAGPKAMLDKTLKDIQDDIDQKEIEKAELVANGTGEALNSMLPTEAADVPDATKDDYFTKISLEISRSSEATSTDEHSTRTASRSQESHGWWFWRSSSSTESVTETSSANSMSQMLNSDVKVSFECMRVDIERPWMRPELFYDDDLRAAPGAL